MENNNTPRKARIYYKGESIPVLVVDEFGRSYELVLAWHMLMEEEGSLAEAIRKRNLYLDALFGWEGAHEAVTTTRTRLALDKYNPDVTLVFDKPEPEEAQAVPVDDTGIDDVPPPIDMHGELKQHLTLLARLGYKVKSFDVSFSDGAIVPVVRATFTKEVDN